MALKLAAAALLLTRSITAAIGSKFASTPLIELQKQTASSPVLTRRDIDPDSLYPAHNLSVPIDHFHNESAYEPHSEGTFNLRYWFDATYYRDGGPVIVLQGGETSGEDRLPYLQKGIVYQLAKATGGLGVILEHRYYGTSFPVPDLSTENLRFLTTEQALADQAYFAQNIVFPGLEDKNLTASNAPYIAYGGSYAGAFVAFLRTQYPQVYWGSIASSGVTKAIYDYWEYYEPIRIYAPHECVTLTQKLVNVMDNIFKHYNNATQPAEQLKALFGLDGLEYNNDFMNTLSFGLGGWQGRNWDPALNDPTFSEYCGNITANTTLRVTSDNATSIAKSLICLGGYEAQVSTLLSPMLNFAGWVNQSLASTCTTGSQNECWTTHNSTYYQQHDLSQSWRSWPYQYCTQWGFLQTGSGVPKTQLPLISRLIDLPYEEIICREAFNITTPPNTQIINKYGGYDIAYDRLAIIDGEDDPWRRATPHAPEAKNRTTTTDEPFILIADAVHHWDENGLFPNQTTATLPPRPIAETQFEEMEFVKAWLAEWNAQKKKG